MNIVNKVWNEGEEAYYSLATIEEHFDTVEDTELGYYLAAVTERLDRVLADEYWEQAGLGEEV